MTPTTAHPPRPARGVRERADLLATLQASRDLLRRAVGGLTDAQVAAGSPCLAALVRQAAAGEEAGWADFLERGATGAAPAGPAAMSLRDTVAEMLADYEQVARRTEVLVLTLPDLDAEQPLPPAASSLPGERRSARRVLLSVVAETTSSAVRADLLRAQLPA